MTYDSTPVQLIVLSVIHLYPYMGTRSLEFVCTRSKSLHDRRENEEFPPFTLPHVIHADGHPILHTRYE